MGLTEIEPESKVRVSWPKLALAAQIRLKNKTLKRMNFRNVFMEFNVKVI